VKESEALTFDSRLLFSIPIACSRFGQELVGLDHRSHGNFSISRAIFHSHDAAFALNADTFGEGDFWREGKRESDVRTLLDGRVQIKADAAGADIAELGGFTLKVAVGDRSIDADRYA
jgi:hypothetical protein